MRKALMMVMLGVCTGTSAPAQVTGSVPAPQAPAPQAPAPQIPAAACAAFAIAQNAVYAHFIRMIVNELPAAELARQNPEQFGQEIEALYRKYMEAAQAGDDNAGRKATALELFLMQLRHQPAAEMTQRKLCMLAQARLPDNAVADSLACAVATLDGPRREQPGSRNAARAMVEQARGLIPPQANASDPGRLLFDETVRGLNGCY